MIAKSCKKLFVGMCCLSFSLLGSFAFGQSFEGKDCLPPCGLHLEGEAKGTKVDVTLAIILENVDATNMAHGAKIVTRAEHGMDQNTLYNELPYATTLDIGDPAGVEAIVIAAISPAIVFLYGSVGQIVHVKNSEIPDPKDVGSNKGMMLKAVLALNNEPVKAD